MEIRVTRALSACFAIHHASRDILNKFDKCLHISKPELKAVATASAMSLTYSKYIMKHRKLDVLLSDACLRQLQKVISYFERLSDCSMLIKCEQELRSVHGPNPRPLAVPSLTENAANVEI